MAGSFSITGTPATGGVGDGARRSLRFARRQLARKLNSLTVATTTGENASGASNANSSFIASALATAVTEDRYRNAWVAVLDGDAVGNIRRVRADQALNLTTGELKVGPDFSARVITGVGIEIHRLLPPEDNDGWTGLRTCLNNALREMWTPARLSITGVNGQPSYSLATYEEWLDSDAVLEIRRQALDSTLNDFPAGTFDVVRNLDALTLQVAPTLPGGDASSIEAFEPLDTWIKVGGVWAASTTGYVNDSDEALINPDLLTVVSLAHAYEALAVGPDGGRYEDMAKKQRLKANVAKEMLLDHRQKRVGAGLAVNWGGVDSKSFQAMRDSW